MHRYFFDVPIFRCSIDSWAKEQEDEKDRLAQQLAKDAEVTSRDRDFAAQWLKPERSAYHYEQMVGMIRLFAINMQIRAELWFVKGRISKNLKRKRWHTANIKVFECSVYSKDDNQRIFKWILNKIKRENKDWILKNRYIDLEAFEHSGKYINYMELAGLKD